MEIFEKSCEQIMYIFKDSVSEEVYTTWADTFEIEEIGAKRVLVTYHGDASIKKFKKECEDILWSCICSVVGFGKTVKIVKSKKKKIKNTKRKKNVQTAKFFIIGLIFAAIAAAIVVVMYNYIANRDFRETFYSINSLKVDNRVRVIQISDLHACSYGADNEELLTRVYELKPDVIVCTGDIVNSASEDLNYAVNLAGKLAEIAPSYYIYGNNEIETIFGFPLNQDELDKKFGFYESTRDETKLSELKDDFEKQLEKVGIKVLKNEKDTIKVKTTSVDVYGVLTSNPSSFWSYSEKSFAEYLGEDKENLKITAIHEPIIFEEFQPEFWGDLMICGHTHGGETRVPILGPLYTHERGFFPEKSGYFAYGRHSVAGRPLIISSGLGNSTLLRINNQPELVIIDINKF